MARVFPALCLFVLMAFAAFTPTPVQAADPEFRLVIKDHRFDPEELIVPAGKRIKLIVENRDAAPEEFESHKLNREKVIPGKSRAIIYVGPLSAGTYPFVGEFHEATAKGRLVAR